MFAAGEAHVKTAHQHGLETDTLTQNILNDWDDINQLDREIPQLEQVNQMYEAGNARQRRQALLNRIGGQNAFDRITQLSFELAPGDRPTVVIDFGSGHYAPRRAWRRATEVWENAGFTVEWNKTSQWV